MSEKKAKTSLDKEFYKLYKKIGEYSADSSDFAVKCSRFEPVEQEAKQ